MTDNTEIREAPDKVVQIVSCHSGWSAVFLNHESSGMCTTPVIAWGLLDGRVEGLVSVGPKIVPVSLAPSFLGYLEPGRVLDDFTLDEFKGDSRG